MPPVSEPQPGAGSMRPAAILGSDPLKRALDENTKAQRDETAAVNALLSKMGYGGGGRLPSERDSWVGKAASQQRQGSPSAVSGWNPGTIGGQRVTGSQAPYESGRTTPGPLAPAQPISLPPQYSGASASMATAQAYNQWQNRPSTRQQPNQQGAPGYVAGWNPGQVSGGGGSPGATFMPQGGAASSFAGGNGGGTSISLPAGVYGGSGGMRPPTGGAAATGAAGGASGGFARARSFVAGNRSSLIGGAAAGAVSAIGGGLASYATRNLNQNYDQFGNLVVLRNGGYSGMTYGQASSGGIDKLRPANFSATSTADLINGGAQLLVNSNNQTFGQNLSNAGVSAYLSPGMGLGQAATNQQQEGTNQANVAGMMMFGKGTRQRGGGQLSEVGLANAALNATRGGRGMTGMNSDKLAAMLQQGGTLRTNLNSYASSAGLGPEAVDSLASILTAQQSYQNKFGNTTDFESTISAAAGGDKSAASKLQGTGIGESQAQSIINRGASQRNRDMNSQDAFIDSLKKSNEWLQKINEGITAIMKSTGADKYLGTAGGADAASGGRGSGALRGAAAGAVIGSFIEPGLGTAIGGFVGGAYGFISGGAEDPVKKTDTAGQNATPAPASGAANAAASFAEAQVGKRYVSGATGPNAYDCSGLMQAAFKTAGVSIPRVSSAQSQWGKAVPLDQIAPGDLIFPKGYDGANGAPAGLPGHVMMALSGGPNVQVVQAANPHDGVINSNIGLGSIESVRRMTDGVGTLSPTQNTTQNGASTTNLSTSAGTAQKTAGHGGSSGMNEVDVLGSVLGRAAFQVAGTTPASSQKIGGSSVNGTSNRAAYAKGVASIDGDQNVDVHDGEMVFDSKLSRSVRSAIMADIPRHTSSGGGGSSINFAPGSITVNVSGSMTRSAALDAGRQMVDHVASDARIKKIGEGL